MKFYAFIIGVGIFWGSIQAQTMRFVAFGDSRTNLGDWQAACAAVNAENPDMVLHTGDLWDGFSPSQWISAVQANSNLNALLGSNKFLATWGNHESNGQLIAVSPSVVRGGSGLFHFQESGVFVAALGDVPDVGYLTTALASQDAQTADWKFIIHHRPVYSAGDHGAGGNGSVESLCDQHGIAISFAGHDHHYERTKLIFGGSVTQTASASDYSADEQGTIYIVTGGAGAPLRGVGSNWWTAPGAASALHYCLVSVYADRIDVDVKDLNGRVIDQFTRRKGLPDPGPYTLDVTAGTGGTVSVDPVQTEYDSGTVVTLTAIPDNGWSFSGWDGSDTENPKTITMSRDMTLNAEFYQPGAELLSNGDFSGGATGWTLSQYNGGAGSGSVTGGEYTVNITSAGSVAWGNQLIQGGISLVQGRTYILSFDGRAASARQISYGMGMNGGAYTSYSQQTAGQEVMADLTTSMQTFSVTFTMTAASDPAARIYFNLGVGGSTANVILDNISLKEDVGTAIAQKPMALVQSHMPELRFTESEIIFNLENPASAELQLYSLSGRLIRDYTSQLRGLQAGESIPSRVEGIKSGVYLIRLKTESRIETSSIILSQ